MANSSKSGYVEDCVNRLAIDIGARSAGTLAHLQNPFIYRFENVLYIYL